MSNKSNVASFAAMKDWLAIPATFRTRLLSNVYCTKCSGETTVVEYTVKPDKLGVVLEGKCKKCLHDVVRLVERQ